jgi:hypothetical protein
MTPRTTWPAPVDEYLRRLRKALAGLPARYRTEVISTLAEHANDRLAEGDSPQAIVDSLGDPVAVAAQAIEEHLHRGGRPSWLTPRRVAQLIAAVLALVAGVAALAFIPAYTAVTVQSGMDGTTQTQTQTVTTMTLLEANGWSALLAVGIPFLLTLVPLLTSGRAWRGTAIAGAVLLAAFVVLGSASVGWYFLPALAAATTGACLPDRRRVHA